MSRLFYHVMQDNVGNLLFDVSGTMRLAGTGTLATIYGDEALSVILPNPMTNHPSYGSFKCFLGAGDYDFYMAKSGYSFETLTGVQGHGTLAQQDANAVAITGGVVGGTTTLNVTAPLIVNDHSVPSPAAGVFAGVHVVMVAGAQRWSVLADGTAPSLFLGPVGFGATAPVGSQAYIAFQKGAQYGLLLRHSDNDTGPGQPIRFMNAANGEVGLIATSATTTSYNTTSDARLKHAITPLTGALDVVRRLRPIAHRWRSDDSPGVGFVADEVQDVIPAGVITGAKDAVDEQGNIQPQMIDMSKLVPYLTAALKEALAQIDTLSARVQALEAAP